MLYEVWGRVQCGDKVMLNVGLNPVFLFESINEPHFEPTCPLLFVFPLSFSVYVCVCVSFHWCE